MSAMHDLDFSLCPLPLQDGYADAVAADLQKGTSKSALPKHVKFNAQPPTGP